MMKLNAKEKIGKWTLLSLTPEGNRWNCRCDCGCPRQVLTKNLISGVTKSCGCTRQPIHQSVMDSAFAEVAHGAR